MDYSKLNKKQLIELLQKATAEKATEEEVTEEVKHWTKADLYKIKDEIIQVQNLTDGVVIFKSPKTHNVYKWHNRFDIEDMTIDEVLQMSNKKLFLKTPLLRVLDDKVCKALGLDYSIIDEISNVEDFIKKDIDTIRTTIEQLSKDYLMELKTDIINAIKNSNISYNKVNALVELFDINRLDLQ